MIPDGPEEREFDTAEYAATAELDADMHELLADESRSAVVVLSDHERIQELKALLRDIAFGASMMLQPEMQLKGAFLGFVTEVKRVADAGRAV